MKKMKLILNVVLITTAMLFNNTIHAGCNAADGTQFALKTYPQSVVYERINSSFSVVPETEPAGHGGESEVTVTDPSGGETIYDKDDALKQVTMDEAGVWQVSADCDGSTVTMTISVCDDGIATPFPETPSTYTDSYSNGVYPAVGTQIDRTLTVDYYWEDLESKVSANFGTGVDFGARSESAGWTFDIGIEYKGVSLGYEYTSPTSGTYSGFSKSGVEGIKWHIDTAVGMADAEFTETAVFTDHNDYLQSVTTTKTDTYTWHDYTASVASECQNN